MRTTTNNASGKPSGARFELPQLTPVNYSLTEGTDIPPPPDSPIEEEPSPPALKKKPDAAPENPTIATANGNLASPTTANGFYDGRGRTSNADQPPLSPASTTRPGSIRRFLSRRSLHNNYTNGTNYNNKSNDDLSMTDRPGTSLDKSRPKRSSSWFRRFGSSSSGNAGNRTSVVYEEERKVMEKKGPPPPSLPELTLGGASGGNGQRLEEDGGSLGGGEMFKNIK